MLFNEIYKLGNDNLLNKKIIAIFGSRKCSDDILQFTKKLSNAFGEAGFVVSSGIAIGVDTQAHLGSLTTGTIVASPVGINNVYPAINAKLYQEILNHNGLIVSYSQKERPNKNDFLIRNQLLADISCAGIVINAEMRSGSFYTCRQFLSRGKLLFVRNGENIGSGNKYFLNNGGIGFSESEEIIQKLSE